MKAHLEKGDSKEYLIFMLGEDEYAINILKIIEIRSYESLNVKEMKINNTPDYIKGITHLYGMIVPIIDLRILYHLKTRSIEKHTIVIVLDVSQQKRIGMIVSSVTGVITLTKEQIEPVTSYGSMVHQSQVQGIGILDNRLITILDPEKILQHHQINVDNI